MNYDFTTLSPDDFESLVSDLLSHEWGVRLEEFKPGKDKGIDLRNSRSLELGGVTIVQCKRYAPHKFTDLLRVVKSEKLKVASLKPSRYVLATTVALSPDNKEALLSELRPWCGNSDDIFGPADLNALLRKFSSVEKAHFKLWISSTAVLERILHSRIFNSTEATLESAKASLSRVVMHYGFDRAFEILRRDHHVLIVGNPGIGKTTLARVLLCNYLKENFEPVCVTGNIGDAWAIVNSYAGTDQKIVVLYDDFLGRLRFDYPKFEKNEDASLLEFLDKVRRSPNLRFILTTREYILADARRIHGAFAQRASEIMKYTLKLEDYSKTQRAKMLFNHLYFSDLPDSRLSRLINNRVYRKLINHTHFNPRVVEAISTHANSRALSDDEYIRFVVQKFDNPAEIWDQPFRSEVGPIGRAILMVLWTFGGIAELESLSYAVRRICADRENLEFALRFEDGLRQLDGNFVATNSHSDRSGKNKFIVMRFSNPSVEEFVDGFISSDRSQMEQLVEAIICFRQVEELLVQPTELDKKVRLSSSYWLRLRLQAVTYELIVCGKFINYRSSGDAARLVWDKEISDLAETTLVRLKIEAKVSLHDDIFLNLQKRVSTADGWCGLIRDFERDETKALAIGNLHDWILTMSGWHVQTISICHSSFRKAVAQILGDEEEACPSSIGALRVVAERIRIFGEPLTEREKELFLYAGRSAAEGVEDNVENPDDVESEIAELTRLGTVCGLDFESEIEILEFYAAELGEEPDREDYSDVEPDSVSRADFDRGLDVDSLFAGLLDR